MFSPKYEPGWSVVDRAEVQPVWTIDDDDSLEDMFIGHDVVGTYTFDMKGDPQCRRALSFARKQLLQQISPMNCNLLIREGWRLTMLRRGRASRIEITYTGRAAFSPTLVGSPKPPYLEYLPN